MKSQMFSEALNPALEQPKRMDGIQKVTLEQQKVVQILPKCWVCCIFSITISERPNPSQSYFSVKSVVPTMLGIQIHADPIPNQNFAEGCYFSLGGMDQPYTPAGKVPENWKFWTIWAFCFRGFSRGLKIETVVHEPRKKLGYSNWLMQHASWGFGDDVLPKACFLKEDHVLEVQGNQQGG